MSLEQHCPLLPLPSRLSGRQTLFARSPAGQWQWGLWKCVGNIWQVEKIFIFMGKEQGKIQRRSLHRDFKKETHRLDILSLAGHNRELKEFCFVAFPATFAPLNNLHCWQFEKGNIPRPRTSKKVSHWTFPGPWYPPPSSPPASAPKTRIQSQLSLVLCLGPVEVSSLVLIGRPAQSGHLGK